MRISIRAAGFILVIGMTAIGACGPNDTNVPGTPGSPLPGTGYTPPPTVISSTSGFNVVAYYNTVNGDVPYFTHEQDLDYVSETVAYSSVNSSGEITTANTYQTGDMILFNGVRLPVGISANTYYFATNIGAAAGTIKVSSTLANAIAGTALPIDTAGSGSFTISLVAEAVLSTSVNANEITVNHTYTTGDEISFPVTYNTQSESVAFGAVTAAVTGPPAVPAQITVANSYTTGDAIEFSAGTGLPTGLTSDVVYYAIRINGTTIEVASSYANAGIGSTINFSPALAGTFTLTDLSVKTYTPLIPTGLYPQTNYYAINAGAGVIKVATTLANAQNGVAITIGAPAPGSFNIAHYIYGNILNSCSIATGTTGEALNCILDGDEEDLWFNGITFQYNVPAGMCNYISVLPYDYYVMEPGNLGVQSVSVNYNVGAGTYLTPSAGNPYVSVSSTGTVTTACPYDYSSNSPAGPNCCDGSYVVNVTDTNPPTTQGIGNIAGGDFGGKEVNCLVGPAVDLQPKDQAGFPLATVIYGVNGVNSTLTVAAPITKFNPYGVQTRSDIYVANYMDLVKYHGGQQIAAIAPSQATDHPAIPTYSFTCLDGAYAVINSINIMVRKWDTEANYTTADDGTSSTQYAAYSATNCPISSSLIGAANGTTNCLGNEDLAPVSLGGAGIDEHWSWRSYQAYWDQSGIPQSYELGGQTYTLQQGGQLVPGAADGLFPADAQESCTEPVCAPWNPGD